MVPSSPKHITSYCTALTHSSAPGESRDRMFTLGISVLCMVVAVQLPLSGRWDTYLRKLILGRPNRLYANISL